MAIDVSAPLPGSGFARPVDDAQRVFRTLLTAMAEPAQPLPLDAGEHVEPPAPLSGAAAACLLTLVDRDTPIWLDPAAGSDVAAYLRFHAGIATTDDPTRAAFAAVIDGRELPPLDGFAQGTPEYPDRSTTLIVQAAGLEEGEARRLAGPGIDGTVQLRLAGVAASLWDWLAGQPGRFPLGPDLLVVTGTDVVGLPRSLALVG